MTFDNLPTSLGDDSAPPPGLLLSVEEQNAVILSDSALASRRTPPGYNAGQFVPSSEWPAMAQDIAQGATAAMILKSYRYPQEAIARVLKADTFAAMVGRYREELSNLGTVKATARWVLERQMPTLARMAEDTSLKASDRLAAISKIADLSCVQQGAPKVAGESGVMLNFNFHGASGDTSYLPPVLQQVIGAP